MIDDKDKAYELYAGPTKAYELYAGPTELQRDAVMQWFDREIMK